MAIRSRLVALGVLGFCIVAATSVVADDWPQWRGPNRNGISAETNWNWNWNQRSPQTLWSKKLGVGCSAVAVQGGKLFTMGNNGRQDIVYCLDPRNGDVMWTQQYDAPKDPKNFDGGPGGTPACDGQYVFTCSRDGQIHCLDANTGQVKWKASTHDFNSRKPDWGFSGSALLYNNLVIFDIGPTVAFDKATGRVVWKSEDYKAGYGSPYNFKLGTYEWIASFNRYGLVVMYPNNGKEITRFKWNTSYGVNAATPVVLQDKVFISSGYNTGAALVQLKQGECQEIWKNRNMNNHMNSCVLYNGHLYGINGNSGKGNLTCLEFATGNVKWSQDGLGTGALMMANGKLIVQGERGDVAIVEASPNGYTEHGRVRGVLSGTCWVVPTLANGLLYCRSNQGDLVCLDVRK